MSLFKNWRRNSAVKKLVAGRSFLNLGATEPHWAGFVTCGLSEGYVDVLQDATEPYPKPFLDHFEFIWSERMLEHIACESFDDVFSGLTTIMAKGARARFCLPICFYGTPKINMVREGNEERCREYGHVSWFTHEGFGPVTDEVFGLASPPNQVSEWSEALKVHGLRYVPVRHYDDNGGLFVDRSIMRDKSENPFLDRPEIVLLRPDSLIFDLIHD